MCSGFTWLLTVKEEHHFKNAVQKFLSIKDNTYDFSNLSISQVNKKIFKWHYAWHRFNNNLDLGWIQWKSSLQSHWNLRLSYEMVQTSFFLWVEVINYPSIQPCAVHLLQGAHDCVMLSVWWMHTLSKWIQTKVAPPPTGNKPTAVTQQVGQISWGLCTLRCQSLIK